MSRPFLVFEEDELVLAAEEITALETVDPEVAQPQSRPYQSITEGARTRVHTKHAGFFYVRKSIADILDLLASLEGVL